LLKLPSPYNDSLCGSEQLFNNNSEPCEPCTPETKQVRWQDIIDKPVCFPTCNPEVVGVTSLNSYTGIVTLGIGSTGNDFNIVNSLGTITLNLPVANATKTGKLSSTDWNTFNNKQNPITLTTTGNNGAATFISNVLNIPNYTLAGLGGVGGTGTLNFLPKWTFTTSLVLGNSIIYDNGAGSIGIGTISPTSKLDVFTLGSTTTTIKARNGNGGILLSATSTNGTISTDWNAPLVFSTNSVERLRVTTAGNVGIGTNTPGSLLDVKGVFRLSGSTSGYVGFTTLNNAGSTTYTLPSSDGTVGQVLSTNGSGVLTWANAGYWILNGTSIYYNTGNVGIGINNPTQLLHVDGGSTLKNILLKTTVSGTANSGYLYENGNGSMKYGGFSTTLGIGTTSAVGFNLFYNSTQVMTIDAGKVGINQNAPFATLDVIAHGSTSATYSLSIAASSIISPFILTRNDGKTLIRNSGGNIYSLNTTSNERVLTVSQGTGIAEVTYPFRIANSYVISGSGVGLGVGLEFNGADYTDNFASIYSITTSYTTLGNSVNDLVFTTKNGSGVVAERFRAKASGELRAQGAVTAGNATLSASAIMQADSTTQGFLPPRMTTAQRDAIASPAAGLMIFNTTTNRVNVYTGTAWDALH